MAFRDAECFREGEEGQLGAGLEGQAEPAQRLHGTGGGDGFQCLSLAGIGIHVVQGGEAPGLGRERGAEARGARQEGGRGQAIHQRRGLAGFLPKGLAAGPRQEAEATDLQRHALVVDQQQVGGDAIAFRLRVTTTRGEAPGRRCSATWPMPPGTSVAPASAATAAATSWKAASSSAGCSRKRPSAGPAARVAVAMPGPRRMAPSRRKAGPCWMPRSARAA